MGHPLNSNVSHHVPSYLMAIFLGIPHFQTWRVPKIWVHGTPQWFSHWQKTITWMILGYHPRAQGSHAPRRAAPQSSRRYGDRVVVPRQGPETGRNYGCFCHMMGIRFLDIFGGTWEGNWADTLLSGVDSLWGELGDSNWPKMREMREWTNTWEIGWWVMDEHPWTQIFRCEQSGPKQYSEMGFHLFALSRHSKV